MGRPAFLYGSPMEWDDVKGCLSRNWKEEVLNYKNNNDRATTESSKLPKPNKFKLNPDIVWTWYRYSQPDTTKNTVINNAKRRLLIAQYSGFGSYSKILKEVSPINRAYAKKWGHDYVTLEGTALQFPGLVYKNDDDDDEVPSCPNVENGYEAQSTFNKIPLLFQALEHATSSSLSDQDSDQVYDQVLILDTDTMIVDLDYDITTLLLRDVQQQHHHLPSDRPDDIILSKEYVMVAYRVWWNDWHWTWDINAGITLWNLNHPTTRQVADTWLEKSMSHPKAVLLKNDDQFFLQRALLSVGWWKRMWDGIRTVREEMEYYDATLIKHFKRDARSWSRTSLDQRLLRIQEAKAVVCQRWPLDCQHIDDDES
ncbi:hypothetical protein IV203_020661 [Nitzschia inconspicua]|nr:hypothetical protein IV203_020661 [Nitzschia inconspicua]